MDLKDKVAIITGASSGIGRAVARNLNEAGVKFILTGRREDRLAALKGELEHAVVLTGDISQDEMPQSLLKNALDAFGHCDIVFNNAGIIKAGSIDEIDIEDVCYMVRVNVEAAFRMAYVAVKHFKSTGSGYLLNTSSVLGTKVRPTAGAYAGTKYAIEALTEALPSSGLSLSFIPNSTFPLPYSLSSVFCPLSSVFWLLASVLCLPSSANYHLRDGHLNSAG